MLGFPWRVMQLRATLFPEQPFPELPDLWPVFNDDEPVDDNQRPRESLRSQSAPYRNGTMEISSNPIRIDVVYTVDHSSLLEYSPSSDALTDLHEFRDYVGPALPKLGFKVNRLAQVAAMWTEAPTRLATYEMLQATLSSVKVDPERMADLLFRVNWPKEIPHCDGMLVNRLTTWSAVKAAISIATDGLARSGGERYFMQLDMDINTPAQRSGPIPEADLAPIYEELCRFALEHMEQGEMAP